MQTVKQAIFVGETKYLTRSERSADLNNYRKKSKSGELEKEEMLVMLALHNCTSTSHIVKKLFFKVLL